MAAGRLDPGVSGGNVPHPEAGGRPVGEHELTGEQRDGLTGQGDEEDILGGMRGIDYDSRPDLRAGQV